MLGCLKWLTIGIIGILGSVPAWSQTEQTDSLAAEITRLDTAVQVEQHAASISNRVARLLETPAPRNYGIHQPFDSLSPRTIKRRVRLVAAANVVGYSAILVGLNAAWYSQFPRGRFRFFNDNREWLQVDKVGHMYGAYIESRASMELWRWTGVNRKTRIWLGGMSGAVYQTIIEVLDGFSADWGWSWGDFAANILGSGVLTAQELAWDDQRIKLKFSFHRNGYGQPDLNARANELFGTSLAERFIKDYNAQTYWASASIKSFFPTSKLPNWLAIAVGYGASGMFGAEENLAKDDAGNITFDRRDVRRYRQWYLAPDIDLTKIKTRKKGLKFLFTVLSAFKFPAPSLEFSRGRFRVNAIHF